MNDLKTLKNDAKSHPVEHGELQTQATGLTVFSLNNL